MDSTIHCLNKWDQKFKILKALELLQIAELSLYSLVFQDQIFVALLAEGNIYIKPLLSAIKIKQLRYQVHTFLECNCLAKQVQSG